MKMLKKNRTLKIIFILAIIMIIVGSTIISNAETFPVKVTGETTSFSGNIVDTSAKILGVFQVVGYSVAVIILAWIGIKYLMATPEGKADIKKQAYAYLFGAFLLFAAGVIVGWLKTSIQENAELITAPAVSSVQIENIKNV